MAKPAKKKVARTPASRPKARMKQVPKAKAKAKPAGAKAPKHASAKKPKPAPKKTPPPAKAAPPPKAGKVLVTPPPKVELLAPPKPESLLTYEKPKIEFAEIQPVPMPKALKSPPEPRKEAPLAPPVLPIQPEEPAPKPEPKPAAKEETPKAPPKPAQKPAPVPEEEILPEPVGEHIPAEAPAPAAQKPAAPLPGGPLEADLDLLPVWEDRLRLRRMIFEDGLAFLAPGADSPEYTESRALLAKTGRKGFRDMPNYFLVCIRDRDGRIVAAMDGHFTNDILVILRSSVSGQKKRELHVLLYSAALSGHSPKYVVFAADRKPLDFSHAGELILLGRGFGMSAFVAEKLLFVRRVKKELDPLSTGPEISKILDSMVPFVPELGKLVVEYSAKNIVALSPLPTSPDSREHLHEIRDAAEALGLIPEDVDQLMEDLKHRYVYGREDITPESL